MSAALTVVGLGSGDADQLTVGIIKKMKHAATLYVRTLDHPVLNDLQQEGLEMTSFDAIYEAKSSFPEVYDEIANQLIEAARKGRLERRLCMPYPVIRWWQKQVYACSKNVVRRWVSHCVSWAGRAS